MPLHREKIRSWKIRSEKVSSYIDWRRAQRKLCLHFRVWLRQSNEMVDDRKMPPP